MRSIRDLGDLRGKRVLIRSDLNVPLDGTTIADDGRIRAGLPTIQALTAQGAKVVVCAHLGRPKGEPNPAFSLAPVAARLQELLGSQVMFSPEPVGAQAQATVVGTFRGQRRAAGERAVLRRGDVQGRRRPR